MASAVQESPVRHNAGQGRSQFSLRGLFIHFTMCALALALLASFPSPVAAALPPLLVVWFVQGTRRQTASGALSGAILGTGLALMGSYPAEPPALLFIVSAVGSLFSWLFAALQAIYCGYVVPGWFGLVTGICVFVSVVYVLTANPL